jgi:hypothetical protein
MGGLFYSPQGKKLHFSLSHLCLLSFSLFTQYPSEIFFLLVYASFSVSLLIFILFSPSLGVFSLDNDCNDWLMAALAMDMEIC